MCVCVCVWSKMVHRVCECMKSPPPHVNMQIFHQRDNSTEPHWRHIRASPSSMTM